MKQETANELVDSPGLPILGMSVLAIAHAVSLFSGLLVQILALRSLSPLEYSNFALLNLISVFCMVVLLGGLPMALRRFVSLHPEHLGTATGLLLKAQLPCSITMGFLLAGLSHHLASLFHQPEFGFILQLVALEVVFRGGFLEPCLYLLNGMHFLVGQAIVMIGYSFFKVLFIASLLKMVGGLESAILGLLLAALATGALAFGLVLRHGGLKWTKKVVDWPNQVWPWLGFSCPYEVLGFSLSAVNFWIVKALQPDHPQLGAYAASTMMARIVPPVGQILAGGTYARVARSYNAKDLIRIRLLLRQGGAVLLILLVPANFIACTYGADLLGILCGPKYGNQDQYCGLLFAGLSLATISHWLGDILGATQQMRLRLLVQASVFLLSVPLTIACTLFFELIGAGLALLLSYLFLTLLLGLGVAVTLGSFWRWTLIVPLVVGVLGALPLRWVIGSPISPREVVLQVLLNLVWFSTVFAVTWWVVRKLANSWNFLIQGAKGQL